MHCKLIKLTNGEDIIAQTDDKCETFVDKEFISVIDPVLIGTIRMPRGAYIVDAFVMQPWLKMAEPDVVLLPTRNIVVAVEVQESTARQYFEYIDETNQRKKSGKYTNLNSLEEEEEITFDEFLQTLQDSDEEEDDDGHPDSRTYH